MVDVRDKNLVPNPTERLEREGKSEARGTSGAKRRDCSSKKGVAEFGKVGRETENDIIPLFWSEKANWRNPQNANPSMTQRFGCSRELFPLREGKRTGFQRQKPHGTRPAQ